MQQGTVLKAETVASGSALVITIQQRLDPPLAAVVGVGQTEPELEGLGGALALPTRACL